MEEQIFEKDLGKVVGTDGITPHIGDNGNWFFGEKDSGVSATGPKGDKGDRGESMTLYRHTLRFDCNGNGVAHYDITDKSSESITAANIATRFGMSSGGDIGASGFVSKNSVMYVISRISIAADGSLVAHGVMLDGSEANSLSITEYSETSGITVTDVITEV